jgi:hypothetical protein
MIQALKIASGKPNDNTPYDKSIVILTRLINYEKNEHMSKINHNSSILHNHSQVIPSAAKTRVDKIKAIKHRKEKKRQQLSGKRKEDLKLKQSDSDLDEELAMLGSEDEAAPPKNHDDDDSEANYYKENIFNKEDYYLYRAIMYFYCGEYEKSIGVAKLAYYLGF